MFYKTDFMNNLFAFLTNNYVFFFISLFRNALFSLSLDGKNLGKHYMVNFKSYLSIFLAKRSKRLATTENDSYANKIMNF